MEASTSAPVFPDGWLKGIALSVWQNSSDTQSNWTAFVKRKKYFGQAKYKDAWEHSNRFWDNYENDIKNAKDVLGTSAFRFSFEWSRFEPSGPGQVDQEAVTKFGRIIDCIRENGMEPMATLHHFTHPQWFEAMGGFTKEENIPLFVDYCKRVFGWFGSKIKLWSTFNEPTCFAFVGYIVNLWCPGKFLDFKLAGVVLANLCKAHVEAYKALKALPGGDVACVGLVHQHIKFMPYQSKPWPWVSWMCKWMTYWFASETVLRFFTTGEFEWRSPRGNKVLVSFRDPSATSSVDWWGINYYSRPCMHWNCMMGAGPDKEPLTDIGFRIYPQGLYDSVVDASVLKVPIYITETGCADKEGKNRAYYIKSHWNQLLRLVRDGYDVRGAFYWTLMDNIEWHEGFHVKYGLYAWDPITQREGMRLRPGSEALVDVHRTWPDGLAELRAFAVAHAVEHMPIPGQAGSSPPQVAASAAAQIPAAAVGASAAGARAAEEEGDKEAADPERIKLMVSA